MLVKYCDSYGKTWYQICASFIIQHRKSDTAILIPPTTQISGYLRAWSRAGRKTDMVVIVRSGDWPITLQ